LQRYEKTYEVPKKKPRKKIGGSDFLLKKNTIKRNS
jgi:hypothetical protein